MPLENPITVDVNMKTMSHCESKASSKGRNNASFTFEFGKHGHISKPPTEKQFL